MEKCNLFDFNNLAIRCFFSSAINANSENPDLKLWKYFVINSIYESIFKGGVSEIVLAIDDKRSWRKNVFPRYKESRRKKRDKSDVDWDLFHNEFNNLIEEIKEYLPFKTIRINEAEADDIIAVIALYGKKDQYVIISNDEDYLQLSSPKIKIYNPQKMMYIKHDNPELFVVEKSLLGQPKDDIFNIKTPINWPYDKRKPGFGPKALKEVMEYDWEKWLNDNNLKERFLINKKLIDFKEIPDYLKSGILNTYNNYKLPDPNNFYSFFKKNNFPSYLENIHNVENNLLKLY